MKKKGMLIVAILLMSIGFAAVSTTLIINGNAKVNENTDDFDVIFTKASLDGTDVYTSVIDDTKKIINFKTNELKTLNQTSVLTYEVTNNSSNYDAEVRINCGVKENTEAKYTSISNVLEGNVSIVKAKESVNGTLTITLNKTATEEVTEEYTCTLEFNAKERDTLGYIYNGPIEWTFDYTGDEQTFTAPVNGTYKLETWGAQGGNTYGSGGYGGYSIGEKNLLHGEKIYINIGNQPVTYDVGGYNGGGTGGISVSAGVYHSGGGGATHIASTSGLIYDIDDSALLIVSGGGGGGDKYTTILLAGTSGGGYKTTIVNCYTYNGSLSTKEKGEYTTKGQGENSSGGGGGYVGGSTRWGILNTSCSATGGSGYIGNPLLTEKSMYCYNCEESTEEETKTISTTCVSETPTENCAKQGNGYARITLIDY